MEDKDDKIARLKAALAGSRAPEPEERPLPEEEAPKGPSRLMELITRLLSPRPPALPAPVAATPPEAPAFTVLVAALAGDTDGTHGAWLQQALKARSVFEVKMLHRIFQLETLEDPSQVAAMALNTRHAVAGEDGDLLVWGEMVKDGYRLRLATAAAPDDDRAAAFGPCTRIELPLEFGDPPANLLYAACLAAVDATTEAQRAALRRLLPSAALLAEPLALKPPVQMAMTQQRSVQLVFGHVAAAAAQVVVAEQSGPWFDKAVNSYRSAQKRLGRTDPGWEAGLIHRHIAAALGVRAERTEQPAALLEDAAKEWRAAAETLTRAIMPQEWAATQVRLGVTLYRLDLITGQTELLREALQALQAALQVYSRTETPSRWADVMHAIAQVLEIYGDQLKSPEVLSRAVDACNSVLEIRTRERTPLGWAATRNTLGSALFLLDRHTEGGSHLDEAERVLVEALEVFQVHRAKGPAKVAARNLAHVRRMMEARRGRQVIDPVWADDPRGEFQGNSRSDPRGRKR